MRGTPTFTQDSVAFPNLVLPGNGIYDRISVTLEARGGGCYGEFFLEFYKFSTEHMALKVSVFGDGWQALVDPRVFPSVEKLMRWDRQHWENKRKNPVTPEVVMKILERDGIGPSSYHLNPTP